MFDDQLQNVFRPGHEYTLSASLSYKPYFYSKGSGVVQNQLKPVWTLPGLLYSDAQVPFEQNITIPIDEKILD